MLTPPLAIRWTKTTSSELLLPAIPIPPMRLLDYIHWLPGVSSGGKAAPGDILMAEVIDILATRLRTPLQVQRQRPAILAITHIFPRPGQSRTACLPIGASLATPERRWRSRSIPLSKSIIVFFLTFFICQLCF
ncbi:hypothetical protein [Massilia scottii]|uniref:hypothetical protein n=1 Tax=Massilia scottii TaxID=3057166 RepID=UPI002796BF15|nr:hypothetical protein [Massilia sp. CCM 9029]MDQ1831049.1 hypothetical protein [Massilia sp. CCM 9029]